MSKKSTSPPQHVRDELDAEIKKRPDIKDYRHHASFSNNRGLWVAQVTFSHPGFPPLNALYEYQKDQKTWTHYWYCTSDWNS